MKILFAKELALRWSEYKTGKRRGQGENLEQKVSWLEGDVLRRNERGGAEQINHRKKPSQFKCFFS